MNEKALHFHSLDAAQLTGKMLAVFRKNSSPIMARLPGNDAWWVPVFTEEQALQAWLAANFQPAVLTLIKLQKIDDGIDFLASLEEQGIRVMFDPYQVGDKTRWTEIMSPQASDKKFPPGVN